MVHAIRILRCANGHVLPIAFDENKCGCHDDGKPCIFIMCSKCLDEVLENKDIKLDKISIPIGPEGMKVVERLLK